MIEELKKDIGILSGNPASNIECKFNTVFLLNDFAGSGDTLLRSETKQEIDNLPRELELDISNWGGKLWYDEKERALVFKGIMSEKEKEVLSSLSSNKDYQVTIKQLFDNSQTAENNLEGKIKKTMSHIRDFIADTAEVYIILYVATQLSLNTLKERLASCIKKYRLNCNIKVVQLLTDDLKISQSSDSEFDKLLKKYYDKSIMNEHLIKGGADVIYGYAGCSLPLILAHNTPNNSVYLLWAEKKGKLHPLFRRVSRHKVES